MIRFMMVGLLALLVGCEYWVEVPAGYVGRVITPKGWEKKTYEAGSTDIGEPVGKAPASRMVMLEVTSNTVKEAFGAATNKQSEDHRILIGKVPVAVDVYIRAMVPEDKQLRSDIYAQITPRTTSTKRVQMINVNLIYNKLAQMDVRSGIRATLGVYESFGAINKNLEKANAKLFMMVKKNFEKNGVPLVLQNVQISNVKPDETVWKAENQNQAALAQVNVIREIGSELRRNPGYLEFMKWEKLAEMNAKGISITIIDGKPSGIVVR